MSRLTVSCILRSFRSSGKRHLILTGDRGSGKSTLLRALARELDPAGLPGITTWAEKRKGVWLKEHLTGKAVEIGHFDPSLPGPENRMQPDPEALTGFGAAALRRAAQAPRAWVSVDEIGYLETTFPAYCDAIRELLDHKRVLAAVRLQKLPFLQEICSRADTFCINLDAPLGQQGCVIMASGLGRRFGGNKLLADLAGKPLIQYILDATEDTFARRVVVTRHPEVAELCRAQGIEVVLHSQPWRSDTVRLGMEALGTSALQGVMFCPADQPLLEQDTVRALALWGACLPGRIRRTIWQGKPGAPVLFPAWAFEELLHLPQGKGGGAVAKQHPDQVDFLEACSAAELADVDRPEDLELLRQRIKS